MKEGHFFRPHKEKRAARVVLGLAEDLGGATIRSQNGATDPTSLRGLPLAAGTKHTGHFPVSKTYPKA